jgi:hypothetical protein
MKRKYLRHFILQLLFLFTINFQAQQFKVLLYTSPDKWHDQTIPVALDQFKKLADKHNFDLVWDQTDGTGFITDVFTEDYLSKVDVIVFLHSKGYDLNNKQMENFKQFIRNGGGFVGIHAVSSSKDQELWFQQLVGRQFINHPEIQTGVLDVINHSHPATMHLNEKWIWTDEWYSFGEALTNNLESLLKVDEKTYDTDKNNGNNKRFTAMGDFHPIAWYQEFD